MNGVSEALFVDQKMFCSTVVINSYDGSSFSEEEDDGGFFCLQMCNL
ncbi:hypothetical protein Pint_06922 [Pistacia integerrima]|uniref:Uncharacterized protein n=1 Tax=Pistacia integerrima TaxID=434235 RepID=A0ACC0XUR3_9ROSI|nr:hypothetical protein Pint_06922 [Pistacia integerrima]